MSIDKGNIKYSMPDRFRTLYNLYERGEITAEQYEASMDKIWEERIAEIQDKEYAQRIKKARELYKIKEKNKKNSQKPNKNKLLIIVLGLVIIAITVISIIFAKNQNKPIPKSETALVSVYITRTGSKYHKEKCDYLKYSKIKITLEEALEEAYSPCSQCNPPIAE